MHAQRHNITVFKALTILIFPDCCNYPEIRHLHLAYTGLFLSPCEGLRSVVSIIFSYGSHNSIQNSLTLTTLGYVFLFPTFKLKNTFGMLVDFSPFYQTLLLFFNLPVFSWLITVTGIQQQQKISLHHCPLLRSPNLAK